MTIRGKRGFTLIEVIVVAGIIAILAGILVPLIFKEIDEARITRAAADVKSISTAIFIFKKDTGNWPSLSDDCTTPITLLEGNGNPPVSDINSYGYDTSITQSFNHYLQTDNGCYPNWKGPYMTDVTADPWGRKYYLNAMDFDTGSSTWIISAGPNGVLETPVTNMIIAGDDVGVMIKPGSPSVF